MDRMRPIAIGGASVALFLGAVVAQHVHEAESVTGEMSVEDTGRELILTTPPVPLPAMAMEADGHGDHDGTFPPVSTVEIPMHGYLRGFDYEVVDGEGNLLPRQILHHFNVIDPVHQELFLPISQRLLAAGQETGGQTMPRLLFGVPVYAGQQIVVSTMLHNPTGVAHDQVSLRIRLKYVKVGRPWPLFEVYPFQIDVAFPAGDKSFDLPPGESSRSWEGSPSMDGRLIVVGSHLHELATHITLEDVTDAKTLWTGLPVHNDDSSLTGVTIGHLYRKLGSKIYTDHTYRVTVFYDNPSPDSLAAGGMGVVGGVFMPKGGGVWPRADVQNPLYALDRSHFMREVRGRYDVITSGGGVVGDSAVADSTHAEHH